MAQPPNLQTAIIFSVLRKKWLNSKLPKLMARMFYRHFYLDTYTDESSKQFDIIYSDVRQNLFSNSTIPRAISINSKAAWEYMIQEITIFSQTLGRHVDSFRLKHIEYCIKRIVITQSGYIDEKQTILNILLDPDSPLLSSHLLKQYLESNDLDNAIDKLKMKIDNKRRHLHRYCKGNATKFNMNLDLLFDVQELRQLDSLHEAWEEMWENRKNKTESALQFAATQGVDTNLNALKYFYNVLPDNEKQKALVETTVYFLKSILNERNVEVMIFLYCNMDEKLWCEIIVSHYLPIFKTFICSWRYRHLCLAFFKVVANSIAYEDFKEMFSCYDIDHSMQYNMYAILNILEAIWMYAPIKFRETEEFVTTIIPKMALTTLNCNQMTVFIKCFSRENQIKVVSKVTFTLWFTKNINSISPCLNDTKCLNLSLNQDIMTKTMLKLFLVSVPIARYAVKDIDRIVKYVLKFDVQVNQFRKELSQDLDFKRKILYMHSSFEQDNIVDWIFQSEVTAISMWVSDLLKSHSLWYYIFNKIVIGEYRYSMSAYYDFDQTVYQYAIATYPTLLKRLMSLCLTVDRINLMYYLNKFLDNYLPEENTRSSWFREYFQSEEGRTGVIQLILNLKWIETDKVFFNEFIYDITYYEKFMNVCVIPFQLQDQVEHILQEYGHPNARKPWEVRYKDGEVSIWNRNKARKLVDARYRCFNCILYNTGVSNHLKDMLMNKSDLTEATVSLEYLMEVLRSKVSVIL